MALHAANLEVVVDGYLATFVTDNSALIIGAVGPFFLVGVTIYFLFTGYMTAFGKIQQPIGDVLNKFVKIATISSVAMSVGAYQTLIITFFEGIPEGLVAALGMGSSIGELFDNGSQPYFDIYDIISKKSSLNPLKVIGLVILGFLYLIVVLIFFAVAFGFYMLTKIAIALLLAIGPFFILLAMFPITQKYLENWINQLMQMSLTQVLLGLLFALLVSIAMLYANRILEDVGVVNWVADTTALMFLLGFFILVIFNVPTIASALTGGFGVDGISSAVSRYIMYRAFRGSRGNTPVRSPSNQSSNSMREGNANSPPAPIYNQQSIQNRT